MSNLTTFSYAGSKITFANESGVRVNATQMARPFGKRPVDWLRFQSSQEFITALCEVRNHTSADLVRVIKGGNGEQGTWMHEDVALEFARWLSPKFAIWCNDRIKELLTARQQPEKDEVLPPPICNTLSNSRLVETIDGKAVTTSRKLAAVLGRKHESVLETIKNNLHQRAFKHGNFTTRDYSSGPSGHGYEFLITRSGLAALAGVMRYNAEKRIAEAYAGAWGAGSRRLPSPADDAPKALPVPAAAVTAPDGDVTGYTPEQQEYIDWLEGYNEKLGGELRDARGTARMYAAMYRNEKRRRVRNGDASGYWHDLYEDLLWRVVLAEGGVTDERMAAHRAFRDRLNYVKKM